MAASNTSLHIRPHGQKFRVIENTDGNEMILRTLDTRDEAENFSAAISHNPNKRKS